jgi:hypothetical protein
MVYRPGSHGLSGHLWFCLRLIGVQSPYRRIYLWIGSGSVPASAPLLLLLRDVRGMSKEASGSRKESPSRTTQTGIHGCMHLLLNHPCLSLSRSHLSSTKSSIHPSILILPSSSFQSFYYSTGWHVGTQPLCFLRKWRLLRTFYINIGCLGVAASLLGPWLERNGPRKAGTIGGSLFCYGHWVAVLGIHVKVSRPLPPLFHSSTAPCCPHDSCASIGLGCHHSAV